MSSNSNQKREGELQPPKWASISELLDAILTMHSTITFYTYALKECADGESGRSHLSSENVLASATYVVFYHAVVRSLASNFKFNTWTATLSIAQVILTGFIFFSVNCLSPNLFERIAFACLYAFNEQLNGNFWREWFPRINGAAVSCEVVLAVLGLSTGVILFPNISTIVQFNACFGIIKIISTFTLLAASRNNNFLLRKLFRRRRNILISMAQQEYEMVQVDEELRRNMPENIRIHIEEQKRCEKNLKQEVKDVEKEISDSINRCCDTVCQWFLCSDTTETLP